MLYFAYGSNMSETKMKALKVGYTRREKATLENHQLVFNKVSKKNANMGFANIQPRPGCIVEGVLYEILEDDMIYLDRCEGFPQHYIKKDIEILDADNNKTTARVYIANQYKVKDNLKPSRDYINQLLEGKEYLSKKYFTNLTKVEVM